MDGMNATRPAVLMVGLPESGLINPMLVLAGELSRRDVADLWFATDDHRRDDVEAAGADGGAPVRFCGLGEVVGELSSVTWDDRTYRRVTGRSRFRARAAVIRKTYVPGAQAEKYRRLLAVVDRVRPSLMVVESMCQYGVQVAITRGIPFVLSNPFVPSNLLTSLVPFGPSYTPKDFPVPHSGRSAHAGPLGRLANRWFRWRMLGLFLSPAMRRRNAEDARIAAELGVDPASAGQFTRTESAAMVLNYSIPELDYPFELPAVFRTVGAMIPPLPQEPPGELTDWLDAQTSVLYAGFGTITRLTRPEVATMVELARRLEGRHQVLWKLPAEQQHLLPDTLPDSLRVVSWVPSQLDVLAHPSVRAFLSHGGGNAYHESLWFGKPMVVRPLWVDCHDQAVRAEDLGVGLSLRRPRRFRIDDLQNAVTRVLEEPAFAENARRFAALQRAAGGRERAADLVTGLLGAGRAAPSVPQP
ncbi:putative glycosyltransferase [Pseudonocardia sp. Ae406_Ps2]|nr:putative glycosyltransferase [Pseudonocardia sp. Ae406_Ps2]OLM06718.1 putative glycosyltransferase [Pseudonocardia sp. Ae331_Ps2]OLM23051.1 putative glycosyltransferase [Pseudonocardia sp. Ae706_Ps2]OLM32119.1 putative glycosyltransferase [Pseudonocardia sp. Ae717_Ps2]